MNKPCAICEAAAIVAAEYEAKYPEYSRSSAIAAEIADAIRQSCTHAQQNSVSCCCGTPTTLNVVHRKDAPCFHWQDSAPSSKPEGR